MNRSSKSLYGESLALFTDLYELTMAYGYWKMGMLEEEGMFHLSFRKWPFQGGFAVAAGLQMVIEYLEKFHFTQDDIAYLGSLLNSEKKPLFEKDFLNYLKDLRFSCDLDALPEGTLVFPYEPIIRVKGPILQAQILESVLLNIINFQTLIATKAARVCLAAGTDSVVEFGMRRAQGIDGAISASRAAYIGGCDSTSHVLAGKLFGIPVKGTQAHSWIMAFEKEIESFEAFANVFPHNCIFLIDTYDTLEGAKNAIRVADSLKDQDFDLMGVRLDSGDLAHLSVEVRKILDQSGYTKTKIMASNELDEYLIRDLKHQGAAISIWGVGTNLVTGKDQPALDGVYKLTALKNLKGVWEDKIKISEQTAKVTIPGFLQVRRFYQEGKLLADAIFDEREAPKKSTEIIEIRDENDRKVLPQNVLYRDLLVPIYRGGKLSYESPSLQEMQRKAKEELASLPNAMKRFIHPQPYFVGLEKHLHDKRIKLIEKMRAK
jgi:nicotinate phosphoribosyltransferase